MDANNWLHYIIVCYFLCIFILIFFKLDPLCPHTKSLEWSSWHNLDSPLGDGDLELFYGPFNKGLACENATSTQIVTADGEVSFNATNQVVHLNNCFGFMCLNREQKNGETCFDYKFRQCCPSKNPASPTTVRPPVTPGGKFFSNEQLIISHFFLYTLILKFVNLRKIIQVLLETALNINVVIVASL